MGGDIELSEERSYSAFSRNSTEPPFLKSPPESIEFWWAAYPYPDQNNIFLLPGTEVIPPPDPQASPTSNQVSTPNVYVKAVQLQFTIEWRVPLKVRVFLYRHDSDEPMFSVHHQGGYTSAVFDPIRMAQKDSTMPSQLLSEATSPLQVRRLPDGTTTAFGSASGNIHDTLPSDKGVVIYTDSFSDSFQPAIVKGTWLTKYNFGRRTLDFHAPVGERYRFSDGGGRAFDSGSRYVWLVLVDVRPPLFFEGLHRSIVAGILGGFKCTAHYA